MRLSKSANLPITISPPPPPLQVPHIIEGEAFLSHVFVPSQISYDLKPCKFIQLWFIKNLISWIDKLCLEWRTILCNYIALHFTEITLTNKAINPKFNLLSFVEQWTLANHCGKGWETYEFHRTWKDHGSTVFINFRGCLIIRFVSHQLYSVSSPSISHWSRRHIL